MAIKPPTSRLQTAARPSCADQTARGDAANRSAAARSSSTARPDEDGALKKLVDLNAGLALLSLISAGAGAVGLAVAAPIALVKDRLSQAPLLLDANGGDVVQAGAHLLLGGLATAAALVGVNVLLERASGGKRD